MRALSALLHPGDHARARSALLPFSNSFSNTSVSEGHLDRSPELEAILAAAEVELKNI